MVGLAQVRRVAPRLKIEAHKTTCDLATLQAVVTHRYEIIAKYAKSVRQTCAAELQNLRAHAIFVDRAALKRWLHIDAARLPDNERQRRDEIVNASKTLTTVYAMREELAAIWKRSTASKEQLVRQLEDWCHRAEESGIEALQEFSRRLRSYA
jgi:stearoyl-CoA desaturase (delta-9 desaturase)